MSTNTQETKLNLTSASQVVELDENDLSEVAGGCGHHYSHPQRKKVVRVVYRRPCCH